MRLLMPFLLMLSLPLVAVAREATLLRFQKLERVNWHGNPVCSIDQNSGFISVDVYCAATSMRDESGLLIRAVLQNQSTEPVEISNPVKTIVYSVNDEKGRRALTLDPASVAVGDGKTSFADRFKDQTNLNVTVNGKPVIEESVSLKSHGQLTVEMKIPQLKFPASAKPEVAGEPLQKHTLLFTMQVQVLDTAARSTHVFMGSYLAAVKQRK